MYSLYFANAKVVKIKCLVVIHLEKGHNLRLRAAFLNSAQNVSSFFFTQSGDKRSACFSGNYSFVDRLQGGQAYISS